MKKKKKISIPEHISLRNFFAIVLTLISVFCLFWPPVLKYSDSYRNDLKKPVIEMYKQKGFSDADAKDYTDALEGDKTFTVYNSRKAANLGAVGNTMAKKYGSGKADETDRAIINNIAINIMFFGLILSGLAACVLYFLNLSRIGGIVHASLSCLLLILCGIMLLFVPELKGKLSPGIGMFLLPLSAAAGCLLFKRQKPVEEPAPSPSKETEEVKAQVLWRCPKCEAKNPEESAFCNLCGTPKPPKKTFCVYCGAPIKPGTKYCPGCGFKQP